MMAITSFASPVVKTGKAASRHAKEYQRLLGASLPHVIETEEENEYYLKVVEGLNARSSALTPAEEKLAELLILLIEDFEERHYALRRASPRETLLELMRANNLKQKDLVDVFAHAQHCLGSDDRQASAHPRTRPAAQRAIPRLPRVVRLDGGGRIVTPEELHMARSKVGIALDAETLASVEKLVRQSMFASRSSGDPGGRGGETGAAGTKPAGTRKRQAQPGF